MHKMGYYIGWHHEDNRKDKPTLATYKSSEFVVLREF